MDTKLQHTVVFLPDETPLDVTYYCSDNRLADDQKKLATRLFIQLNDCICTLITPKFILKEKNAIETIVHNKVVSEKGHLC